jgi:hypothetical protein
LCSLSRSQILLQFVMCHIQVNGAGFSVVPDESNLFSFYLVICLGTPKYVEYLLVWLDIFSKSVKFELSRTLICVLKVLKIFTHVKETWRSQNLRLNIDLLD